MKKWIFIAVSLSLLLLYSSDIRFMFVKKPVESDTVSQMNILSHLKDQAQRKDPLNYLVLGDSVARGFGSQKTGPHGYSSLVAKALKEEGIDLDLVNRGVVGQTSAKLLQSIQDSQIQTDIRNADLISLTIGGNDLLKVALEEEKPLHILFSFDEIQAKYEKNLSSIITTIRSLNRDAPILITSLYNPISPEKSYYRISNQMLKRWNSDMKRVADRNPFTYVVNVTDRLQGEEEQWLYDQIHPNDQGYRLMAGGILDEIRAKRTVSASVK